MRYVQNQKSDTRKSIVHKLLVDVLGILNRKLSDMEELAIKEGNQNWRKSKLAIILISIKKLVMQILTLGNAEPKDPEAKKKWKMKMKELLRALWGMVQLADEEMQKQHEREQEKVKVVDTHENQELLEKRKRMLNPMQAFILQKARNIR